MSVTRVKIIENHHNLNINPARFSQIYWVLGESVTAPTAGQALVTHVCHTHKKTYILGYREYTNDPAGNIFSVNWKHNGNLHAFPPDYFGSFGTVQNKSETIPINSILPADAASDITITCKKAGTAGFDYQVALLVMEADL